MAKLNDKATEYSDSQIKVLQGLEPVRKRPGMYIGSTDSRGLHHLVWEIIDNAIDEAMAGYGNTITVTLKKDNSIMVQDEGRGVPCGIHPVEKIPTTQVIYTKLHSGGKFNDAAYKTSSGLHGVGGAVVNALSTYFEVTSYREGSIHRQIFEKGGTKIHPLEDLGKTNKTGTIIYFKPDPSMFTTTDYNRNIIEERLREHAFLLNKISFVFDDEKNKKKDIYKYDNGVIDFVEYINDNKVKMFDPIYINASSNNIDVELAIQYCNDSYDDNVYSFVNIIRTKDGGTHEIGFKGGLTRAFNDYAKENNLVKEKDKINGDDYREGMTAVLSLRIPESLLQFEGQVKSKLGTQEARSIVESIVYEKFSYFLKENKEIAKELVNKALKSASAREAARKARELARGQKQKESRLLSGKLTPAQSKNPSLTELFLVEGDSAGGSAKQARERLYQAILPLRGKVINSEKNDLQSLLKNEEISTIIHTIGAGYGKEFDVKESNYDKIIIMTDADVDGSHIQVLLLTFFYRLMRPLIENGKVYIAMPPLYKVYKITPKGEKFLYAWDNDGLLDARAKIGTGSLIQRYKGLGEMNPDQLWETTMDPTTRSLIKVNIEDMIIADRQLSILMGNDASPRKKWIEENVQFTMEDDYLETNGGK